MKKNEIFILRKFKEKKKHQRTQKNRRKIKANLNLMKLKAQTEIPEDKNYPLYNQIPGIITNYRNYGTLPYRNTIIPHRAIGRKLKKKKKEE